MSLAGRTALITGGGRGIGRAIAHKLASQGARVIVAARTREQIESVASETGGVAVTLDLTDRVAIAEVATRLLETHQGIDILVNNAGIASSAAFVSTPDEELDRIMAVNVAAPFALTRALLPHMLLAKWGRIVNVASNAGLLGYAYSSAYCASKHAVVGLTRALAAEIPTSGVTVNAVCPGFVDTEIVSATVQRIASKTGRTEDDARRSLEAMSPQRRLISPEEVAHAVLWLLQHEARGIHGQAIAIDGGRT